MTPKLYIMITNSYNLQANHTIKNFKSKLQLQGKIVSYGIIFTNK